MYYSLRKKGKEDKNFSFFSKQSVSQPQIKTLPCILVLNLLIVDLIDTYLKMICKIKVSILYLIFLVASYHVSGNTVLLEKTLEDMDMI